MNRGKNVLFTLMQHMLKLELVPEPEPKEVRLRNTDSYISGRTSMFAMHLSHRSPCQVSVLVMCHTRELAFQISKEYERFSKFLPNLKASTGIYCQPSRCRQEFADHDPERQELAAKNLKLKFFLLKY